MQLTEKNEFFPLKYIGGLTALPPRGGPWKLGSGLGQNPEANTALGVGRGCARLRALFESLGLDGLRSPPSLYPHPLSPPQVPLFNNTEQSWAGPGKGPE